MNTPIARIAIEQLGTAAAATNWDQKYPTVPAQDGTTHLLQVWTTATSHTCRVLSADGSTVETIATTSAVNSPVSVPGAIRLFATGHVATVDHVRVYVSPGG